MSNIKSLAREVLEYSLLGTNAFVKNAANSIYEMQQAIKALANDVTKYSAVEVNKTNDPRFEGRRKSRDSFNNFFVTHYLSESPQKGVEYTPDPNKMKKEDKDPSDLMRMQVVMDSLQRIGSPVAGGVERMPDGAWDFRTNNALRNVAALSHSLVKLSNDFNLQSKDFTQKDADFLTSTIKNDVKDYKGQNLNALAGQLTPIINKAKDLYNNLRKNVLENPKLKSFIDEKQELATYSQYDKTEGANLNKEEKNIFDKITSDNPADQAIKQKYSDYNNMPQIDIGGKKVFISLNALLNKEAFDQWKKANSLTEDDSVLISLIQESIAKQLKPLQQLQGVSTRRYQDTGRNEKYAQYNERYKQILGEYNQWISQYQTLQAQDVGFWKARKNSQLRDIAKEINIRADQMEALKKEMTDNGFGDVAAKVPSLKKYEE